MSIDGSYAVFLDSAHKEVSALRVLFPVLHRSGGLLGKIIEKGQNCLSAVIIVWQFLLKVIPSRLRIIVFGGLINRKEYLPQGTQTGTQTGVASTLLTKCLFSP